ncbi:phosphotransferase family protein [Streptomyces sp. NPDC098781]|uniref:phosphotransferase family protein n=1 Tax=Streptomyces sp. NPDC098781 TaxID=3366097 RepID=UPI0038149DBD
MEERVLGGGAVNQVVRVGTTVRRRPSERSGYVRELLAHFESRGWEGAPRHLGTDQQGREVFGYVEGRVAITPRERAAACTDAGLLRVVQLVRAVHDMTHGTPLAAGLDVVCHNDLAPKNTVYTVEDGDWWPTALIDWDLAAPGERVHDLAHLCWQYLDLGPGVGDVAEAARRIALVLDAYGPCLGGEGIVDVILWWQDRCLRGIEEGAARGEASMLGLRERGAVDDVRNAYAWTAEHRRELGAFLR